MCLCIWRLPRYIFSEHKSAAQSKLLHIQYERVCVYGKFSNFLPWGIKLGVLFAEESANCTKLWTFLTLYGRKICGCRFFTTFPSLPAPRASRKFRPVWEVEKCTVGIFVSQKCGRRVVDSLINKMMERNRTELILAPISLRSLTDLARKSLCCWWTRLTHTHCCCECCYCLVMWGYGCGFGLIIFRRSTERALKH